ncbi:MAG: type II toxin-antitoxin system PemK/MazF family toxin [Chloroflexi bacterium]|nr:type II toxin-antitoxin system PemK/MazF family toxin [Chloroflexota bacterium]MBI2983271.1 type II toxin-antitoxin system PemK/MazF family toxin [Chloroflexota bacterium]
MARSTGHGEIWIADLDKRRPAVVISRNDVRGVRQRTTVAPVTSTIRGIPSEVALAAADGIREPSAVNCDELVTIPKSLLVRQIGKLTGEKLDALHRALAFALALPR